MLPSCHLIYFRQVTRKHNFKPWPYIPSYHFKGLIGHTFTWLSGCHLRLSISEDDLAFSSKIASPSFFPPFHCHFLYQASWGIFAFSPTLGPDVNLCGDTQSFMFSTTRMATPLIQVVIIARLSQKPSSASPYI